VARLPLIRCPLYVFLREVRTLLAPDVGYDAEEAVRLIRREFIERLPGEPWRGLS